MSRGQNNNNPFNIIKSSIGWFGKLKGMFLETKFETFDTLENGVRAGLLNLKNGYKNKGYVTVDSIIKRYAPLYDNSALSQKNYISAVSLAVHGYSSASFVPLVTADNWINLAASILKFENGKEIISLVQLKKINNDQKIFI